MTEAFTEILRAVERAAAGSEADKSALAQLLGGIDLVSLAGPEDRAYLAVLLDWMGMRELAMLALRPADGEHGDHYAVMPNLAGTLASKHGDYEQAHELFMQALSAADDDARLEARITANLAALSLLAGDIGRTSLWLAQARGAHGNASDPATGILLASTEFGLARAQGDRAGMREAIFRLNEATRARVAELGSDHPLALTAVASLAATEFELATVEESVEGQERATAVLEVAAHRLAADLGADHPQALACLENLCVADFLLARASRSQDRTTRAATTLGAVSRRVSVSLGEDHPQAHAAAVNAASARLEVRRAQGQVPSEEGPKQARAATVSAASARPGLSRTRGTITMLLPGVRPNFFNLLGLTPDEPWDDTAYARALSEKRNMWSRQLQGIKTHDGTREAQRNLSYMREIQRVMQDPTDREAERLAALREADDLLDWRRDLIADRLSIMLARGYLYEEEYEELRGDEAVRTDDSLRLLVESAERRTSGQTRGDQGQLDEATTQALRECLRIIGQPDLYAALRVVAPGIREESPAERLLEAADELYWKARNTADKQGPEVGAMQNLAGLASRIFRSRDLRWRHDASMRLRALDEPSTGTSPPWRSTRPSTLHSSRGSWPRRQQRVLTSTSRVATSSRASEAAVGQSRYRPLPPRPGYGLPSGAHTARA